MAVVKIEWNTVRQHRVYLEVPDEFDPNDYDMDQILGGEIDEDACETGDLFEREALEVYPHTPRERDPVVTLPGLSEFRLP
mgnify:CR=1 FL=1